MTTPKKEGILCPLCKKAFASVDLLQAHYQKVHKHGVEEEKNGTGVATELKKCKHCFVEFGAVFNVRLCAR